MPDTLLPRALDFLPNAASINREIAIRNLSNSPAGYHYHLAAFESLRATVATFLLYSEIGRAVEHGISNRILDAVLVQYKTAHLELYEKGWAALWESLAPISRLLGRMDRPVCDAVSRSFGKTSDAVEAYHFRLLLAFSLQWDRRCRERLVPCAACPRFFVARTAKAMTCSAACRQRYYRETQDEEGRQRLQRQAREYKQAQRELVRAATTGKPHKPAKAKPTTRGGTSRPSR